MKLTISQKKGVPISEGMIGLFFEDINYAADGGLYAEMIENRSFEFMDCYGDKGDYYVKHDCGYGWSIAGEGKDSGGDLSADDPGCIMEYVMGSPIERSNPHYLRFTAREEGKGFSNQAYGGIFLEEGKEYKVSFYARCVSYEGRVQVLVRKEGKICAQAGVSLIHASEGEGQSWRRYETVLKAGEDVKAGEFTILLEKKGTLEFDFISMMPADAVAGIFRRDLFEALENLHPGFIRFPGGCIIEGNTLENRYRWKESVGRPESRRGNFNRWAVHETSAENGWHTSYSHYNQTLGLGYYEYFLLCELIGAKPLPVLNVGLACQYQSYELVSMEDAAFGEFVQDALDLIEFANGSADTLWGALRAGMGHPEPFGLTMVGIGNEQWQTEKVDFYERYRVFEKAIHAKYPQMKLIGSAGPDVLTDRYERAWDFYRKEAKGNPDFCYAVDEHYYVKPQWFYEHTDFYDGYSREVKVFSGEYAAHPVNGMNRGDANTLGGALAEAAFLTGVERNADVVALASYAPLFARLGYAQWSPDMIWFDEEKVYCSPSYYVQKLYSENTGTVTMSMEGQEKELAGEGIYVNVSLDEKKGEYILKAVNPAKEKKELQIYGENGEPVCGKALAYILTGDAPWPQKEQAQGKASGAGWPLPEKASIKTKEIVLEGSFVLEAESFSVVRISVQ